MILAHRIALDPTDKQRSYFARAAGCARLAYNWALAEWQEQYHLGGRPKESELRRLFNATKGERFPFVYEVAKEVVQTAIIDLGDAFKRFFKSQGDRKAGKPDREVGYPQFKKKGQHDAFDVRTESGFAVDGERVKLARIGWVRMREALRFDGRIAKATVSRTAGRWFISVAVEMPDPVPPKREAASVGIDWGCTNFATLSTGEKVKGPKPHKALLDRLRRLNQSLHRKVKGSRNRAKAKTKLARLHARIANVRLDFLHKFTTDIVRRFTTVGIEDLNVSGMAKNHSLARSILDQAPYELKRQLEYKAPMFGAVLVKAPRFYPSSKLCGACGAKVDSLPLSVREWACPKCGAVHDRDGNASDNLRNYAVSSTVKASGAISAGPGTAGVKLAALKEEPDARNSAGIFG